MADHSQVQGFTEAEATPDIRTKDSNAQVPGFFIGTGVSVVTTFKMRGRDDGAAAPGYVTWTSTIPDFLGVDSGSSVPAIVGSLIPGSVVEVSRWTDP